MASPVCRTEVATQLAMSRHATRMALQQQPFTLIDHVDSHLVRFDADFIERKLQEHRERQELAAAQMTTEIIYEVCDMVESARRAHSQRLILAAKSTELR